MKKERRMKNGRFECLPHLPLTLCTRAFLGTSCSQSIGEELESGYCLPLTAFLSCSALTFKNSCQSENLRLYFFSQGRDLLASGGQIRIDILLLHPDGCFCIGYQLLWPRV
jgi:hypothetical protein